MVLSNMDLSGSEQSSDSLGSPDGSFAKLWGTETSLLLGLKDGSLAALTDLVHDKDVAAKAVAFVVNSSRRGIVPLCCDVATILRGKLKLERTIEKQRAEIHRLKQGGATLSTRTSRSTSPTHPLIEGQPSNRLKKLADSPHMSSPCSPCSSSRSPSPLLPNSLELSSASCGSFGDAPSSMPVPPSPHHHQPRPHPEAQDHHPHHHHHPHNHQTPHSHPQSPHRTHDHQSPLPPPSLGEGAVAPVSPCPLLPNQHVVTAEVHTIPNAASLQGGVDSGTRKAEGKSVEVQCSPPEDTEGCRTLHQQYQEACQARATLEEELRRVRHELEQVRLGSKVTERSKDTEESSNPCEMQVENETCPAPLPRRVRSHSVQGVSELPHPPLCPSHSEARTQGLPAIRSPRISPRNSDLSAGVKGEGSSEKVTKVEAHHNLTVRLEDHALIAGERTGYVKYIGHLDRSTAPQTLFVGLHLDAPVGKHDGMVHGRRYFWCPRNHGVFVPVNDVLAVINRKTTKRAKTVDPRRRASSHGVGVYPTTSHSSSSGGHGVEMKRVKPGQAKRLISADSSTLTTHQQKTREHRGTSSS